MSNPTVIEITPRTEAVARDTFIDDIAPRSVLTTRPAGDPPSAPPGYR